MKELPPGGEEEEEEEEEGEEEADKNEDDDDKESAAITEMNVDSEESSAFTSQERTQASGPSRRQAARSREPEGKRPEHTEELQERFSSRH